MPELARDTPDLWNKSRDGDAAARDELARLAHAIALRELARRGAPRDDHDDLAQEAVRATLAGLDRGHEAPRDLPAFLKYKAWGVLSDLRKRMRARPRAIEASEVDPPSPATGPEGGVRASELAAALRACRERLPLDQRETLRLRYELGLESDESAERLGTTRNAVHVRVCRALAALRECLRRRGFEGGDLR